MATIQSTIQINDKFSKALRSLSSGLDDVVKKLKTIESTASKINFGGGFQKASVSINNLDKAFTKSIFTANRLNNLLNEYKTNSAKLPSINEKFERINATMNKLNKNTSVGFVNQWERVRSVIEDINNRANTLRNHLNRVKEPVMRLNALTEKLKNSTDKVKTAQDKVNDSASKHKKHIDNANRSLFGMWGNLRRIATTWLSFQSIKTLVNAGDNYINSTARLDLMNDGLQTTKELQDKIYQSAQRTYSSYTDTANAVAKLGILAGKSFKNNDEIIQFTELVQKQFAVSGASTQEKNAAMYQLTQAMASNALKGDEFVSILENAPLITQTISEALGVTSGKLKDMASEGLITADVIKNAMFGAADDINEKFEKMSLTFGAIWTQVVNKITMALRPLYERMKELWNSDKFQNFVNSMVDGFLILMAIGGQALEYLTQIAEFVYDNWSLIEPVVWGIVAAMTAYYGILILTKSAMLILKGIQWGHFIITSMLTAMKWLFTAATWASTSATLQQAAAQWGLNAALWACPITWIIMAFIAIIAVIFLVIAGINKLCDTSYSATGFIAGVFAWLGATLYNIVVGALNAILDILDLFLEPILTLADWIYGAFVNGFTGWIGFVQNILGQFIAYVLSIVKPLLSVWDAVMGTDYHAKISVAQDEFRSWGKTEDYAKKSNTARNALSLRDQFGFDKRTSATEWYDKGYNWGANLGDKISSKFDPSKYGEIGENASTFDKIMNGIDKSVGVGKQPNVDFGGAGGTSPTAEDLLKQIADNTAGTNDELMRNNADMSYLRDLAERKAINKISDIKVKVDMTNNNTVNSDFDLDKIADYLGEKVFNTITSSAAGVHY